MKYKYVRLQYQCSEGKISDGTYTFRYWHMDDLKMAQRRLIEQQKAYPKMKWWLEKSVQGLDASPWVPLHACSLFS